MGSGNSTYRINEVIDEPGYGPMSTPWVANRDTPIGTLKADRFRSKTALGNREYPEPLVY